MHTILWMTTEIKEITFKVIWPVGIQAPHSPYLLSAGQWDTWY
jgi:hypothetical protein